MKQDKLTKVKTQLKNIIYLFEESESGKEELLDALKMLLAEIEYME